MRDSKKALFSTAVVFLTVLLLSGTLLWSTSSDTGNYDLQLRDDLAGTIDFLIVGASHGQCALYTEELDRILGCNSYNLAYDSMKNFEKRYLLQKELDRNHVETVVLELSYDTLLRGRTTEYTDTNIFTVMRMSSFWDRLRYYFQYVNLDNKLFVYSEWMFNSLSTVNRNLFSQEKSVNPEKAKLKGSRLLRARDRSLPCDKVVETYNKEKISISDFNTETVEGFAELIQLCHSYDTRVIVAVVPVSDNYIWRYSDLDEFYEWASAFCDEQGAEFYDFNLLKERYVLFSDIDCYSTDIHHMSEKGAVVFSPVFAEIIKAAGEGQDITEFFYSNFSELKKDSPYMQYITTK